MVNKVITELKNYFPLSMWLKKEKKDKKPSATAEESKDNSQGIVDSAKSFRDLKKLLREYETLKCLHEQRRMFMSIISI